MFPTCVSVPVLHSRRGRTLQQYAQHLAALLKVLVYTAPENPTSRSQLFAGALLVANTAPAALDVPVLVPFDEEGPLARGIGEVLFPFGSGSSAIHAMQESLPIVQALGLDVLFYHTTWRNPEVSSEMPDLHLSRSAIEVMQAVGKLASDAGVRHRTILEVSEGVIDGTLLRALTEHCALIVTARGCNTGRGSYVDQWLAKSPIPMLVMPRKESA